MIVALPSPSDLSEPSAESSPCIYWKWGREIESDTESKCERNRDREREISQECFWVPEQKVVYIISTCILLSRVQLMANLFSREAANVEEYMDMGQH